MAGLEVHQVTKNKTIQNASSIENIYCEWPFSGPSILKIKNLPLLHILEISIDTKQFSYVSVLIICNHILMLIVICSFGMIKQIWPIESADIQNGQPQYVLFPSG